MGGAIAIIYANLKGNIGDFAILHAMLADIASKRPGAPVDVYAHGFVPVDQRRLAAFEKSAPPFTLAGTTFVDGMGPNRLAKRVLKFSRLTSSYQRHRIAELAKNTSSQAADFSRYSEIYVAGGAQWTGDQSGVSMFGTLLAISAHNDRIFSYPVSVTSSLCRRLNDAGDVRRYLSHIRQPIIVRDSTSEVILKSIGLNVTLGSDCVFSLGRLGEGFWPQTQSDPSRLLMVVTNQDLKVLTTVAVRMKAAGLTPVLLSTCEIEDAAIYGKAADIAGIDCLFPLSWQEVVTEMKGSGLVVSNRLHGIILASLARVPVLPLVDRAKVLAAVGDIGMPLKLSDLQQLDGAIVSAAMNRSAELVGILSEYRDRAQRTTFSPIV